MHSIPYDGGDGQLRLDVFYRKGRPLELGDLLLLPDGCQFNLFRKDDFGNLMCFEDYGKRMSAFGWELDHHPVPAFMGGGKTFDNLRPLHWQVNARHGGLLSAMMR